MEQVLNLFDAGFCQVTGFVLTFIRLLGHSFDWLLCSACLISAGLTKTPDHRNRNGKCKLYMYYVKQSCSLKKLKKA
jgi:hypothetical protein